MPGCWAATPPSPNYSAMMPCGPSTAPTRALAPPSKNSFLPTAPMWLWALWKTPELWPSTTSGASSSLTRATTTPAKSCPTRAQLPASAASSAMSTAWAQLLWLPPIPCVSAIPTAPRPTRCAGWLKAWWTESGSTATLSVFPTWAETSSSMTASTTTAWSTSFLLASCGATRSSAPVRRPWPARRATT